jgi:hypothetical protein
MFVHTGISIPQAIFRPPHFHSFAQVAAPPIKGGIRSWNHRSRARMWSLSSAQTSADASQDSTANVMAGWGLAKVNRADWRPAAQQHVWRRTSSAGKRPRGRPVKEFSEEYRRQICAGRLVVEPRAHQRHWLDDSKAILKAPTEKVWIARRHDDGWSCKGFAEAINAWRSRLVSATACLRKASAVAYPLIWYRGSANSGSGTQ